MSDGLLKNLNWSNLFVAGGIVLGSLLSVDTPDPRWKSSDIDIYVYGLTPDEANEKIKHLFETFRTNLPAGTPTLVVRNCTTITFYARYPLRRIQIVLKLGESPKSVLLNFDLDVCAMGWDGTTLWMLPRAARALETGCNVFTMDLIRGHYLSDRRASTQERIFKYADKGYGIRILPSYISSLVAPSSKRKKGKKLAAPDISVIVAQEREWTADEIKAALRRGVPDIGLNCVMPKLAGYRGTRCLKGFRIFMRCVALWEMAHRKEVIVKEDVWASTSYADAMTAYDDAPNPKYKWDNKFNTKAFGKHIDEANVEEISDWIHTDFDGRLLPHGVEEGGLLAFHRMTYAPTVDALLSKNKDIVMQVLLPCEFAVYANNVVSKAQARAGLPETTLLTPAVPGFDFVGASDPKTDGLFFWHIGKELMWQQLDRRVDEVFEVLYAFRRVNEQLREGDYRQERRVKVELARREFYVEFDAFALWVGSQAAVQGPYWDDWNEY
ncbi:hypothetical protein C8R44DRAFT_357130 [Mycena epipterygia]|nr:hypothetical protein C8R44DRAFT_357130 [Mycena epipterygia]